MQQAIRARSNRKVGVVKSKITQREAVRLVGKYAQEIKSSGVDLKKVYLFGSYAKNSQREWSDIDVALVSDGFSGFGYNDLDLLGDICVKRDYVPIQAKFYSTKYFKKSDPFIEEILKTGIEIPIF